MLYILFGFNLSLLFAPVVHRQSLEEPLLHGPQPGVVQRHVSLQEMILQLGPTSKRLGLGAVKANEVVAAVGGRVTLQPVGGEGGGGGEHGAGAAAQPAYLVLQMQNR